MAAATAGAGAPRAKRTCRKSGFWIFMRQVKESLKRDMGRSRHGTILKATAAEWRRLPESERRRYGAVANAEAPAPSLALSSAPSSTCSASAGGGAGGEAQLAAEPAAKPQAAFRRGQGPPCPLLQPGSPRGKPERTLLLAEASNDQLLEELDRRLYTSGSAPPQGPVVEGGRTGKRPPRCQRGLDATIAGSLGNRSGPSTGTRQATAAAASAAAAMAAPTSPALAALAHFKILKRAAPDMSKAKEEAPRPAAAAAAAEEEPLEDVVVVSSKLARTT